MFTTNWSNPVDELCRCRLLHMACHNKLTKATASGGTSKKGSDKGGGASKKGADKGGGAAQQGAGSRYMTGLAGDGRRLRPVTLRMLP